MNISKPTIASFYIALIILFKVAGLHALAPHGDDMDSQHCEVCHITTAVGLTPLLEADISDVPQAAFFFPITLGEINTHQVFLQSAERSGHLFTRPPPPCV